MTSLMFCYLNCLVIFVHSARLLQNSCDVSSTEDLIKRCYAKEVLATLAHSSNQLAINKFTNTLYFGLDAGHGEYIPGILDINTKKITALKGAKDAFALATDPETGDIYIGGSHGIYKYNSVDKELKRLYIKKLDVWWLFVKKVIYFVQFPTLNAFLYHNKSIENSPQLKGSTVHQFVFDKEDNLYFINSTGLFGIKHDHLQPFLITDHPKFVGMSIDNEGKVYVCSEDGIFVVKKLTFRVSKVINIQGVLGLTFDKYNFMIYSDSSQLVRLVPIATTNLE